MKVVKVIFYTLGLCSLLTSYSLAQTMDSTYTKDSTYKVDPKYVGSYKDKITIIGFFSRDYIEVAKETKPNSPINFGIGLVFKNTSFKVSYKLPVIKMNENKYGKTDITDIQIHYYGRHLLFDVFYQRYKGFYTDEKEIKILPNTSVQKIGFGGNYLFNGYKYSAKAAFFPIEKQLQSVGGYVLGGGVYYYKIGLESPEQLSFNNLLFELNAGYYYSWVLSDNWLIAGIATAGITLGNETEKLKDGKIKIYPTIFARGAIGYHHSFWGIYFSFLLHSNSLQYSNNNKLNLTGIDMQISNVIRFNSFY